jgi:glucose-1-phosphate thymidylyltransferase
MKTIILAAGYATRLYPITINAPKPLLQVGGRPLLEYLFENFADHKAIKDVFIVTNDKFHRHFTDWHGRFLANNKKLNVKIINDGSKEETKKLGAIGDLLHVIRKEKIDDDVLVFAGDNLFEKPLHDYIDQLIEKNLPMVGMHAVDDLEKVKKLSAIETNQSNQIIAFEEKPKDPKTTMTGIALYYYPKKVLPLIHDYINEGNNPDHPGRLVEWLYKKIPVFGQAVSGTWFDVGSSELLKETEDFLARRTAGKEKNLSKKLPKKPKNS